MSFLNRLYRLLGWALLLGLSACGGSGESSSSVASTPGTSSSKTSVLGSSNSAYSSSDDNVFTVTVNAGPVNAKYQVNRLHASVTICEPGTNNCATIPDVLVDSGSTGLRLLASSIPSTLKLSNPTNPSLVACQQYLDGTFSWGPVVTADIVLSNSLSKRASNLPMQVIADPRYNPFASRCSSSGEPLESLESLGANGILGIGVSEQDCGSRCTRISNNNYYFNCSASSCTGRTVPQTQQIQNPIAAMSTENNGYAIILPAIDESNASNLSNGAIVMGIGTRTNNQAPLATVLTSRNTNGYITTSGSFGSKTNSFLDTGSNGLFFDDTSLAPCAPDNGFYCPPVSRTYSATLTGANGLSKTVSFTIDNATSLFTTGNHALPGLGGPINSSSIFDWGLPFFYGRTVLIGFDGKTATVGGATATGPYYAF